MVTQAGGGADGYTDRSIPPSSGITRASITLGGRPVAYADLRRGMVATVIRDGDAPASEVRATRR
jgi:hypothetical protein